MKTTIKLNREFAYAYKKGTKIVADTLVLYCYINRQTESRLGLTVSTALGGAVVRNRLKRLMRAAFGARKCDVKKGYNIIIAARGRMKGARFTKICDDLDFCLKKADLI